MKKPSFLEHPLSKRILVEQFQPLRILFYVHLLSFLIPSLHLSLKTSLFIFNNIPLLIIANIPFVIFIEYDKLRKKSKLEAFSWLLLFFIGLLGVEFVGLAVHTHTSFFDPQDPEIFFWNVIALLFTGIGGFVLTITNYVGEKLNERITLSRKQQKIIPFFLLFIAILLNIYSMYVNPQWGYFFNYLDSLF